MEQLVGYAEYVFNSTTQAPNDSVPPYSAESSFTAFTIPTEVYNNVPLSISALTTPAGTTSGTYFTLHTGTYIIDYETTLTSSGSIAIYIGPTPTSLAIDNNTISGSSTATTWIHGRNIQVVAVESIFAVSSVVDTVAVSPASSSPRYIVRLTILKIA